MFSIFSVVTQTTNKKETDKNMKILRKIICGTNNRARSSQPIRHRGAKLVTNQARA